MPLGNWVFAAAELNRQDLDVSGLCFFFFLFVFLLNFTIRNTTFCLCATFTLKSERVKTGCECSHEGLFDILLVFSSSVHDNQRPDFEWFHPSATETCRLGRENIPVKEYRLLLRKLFGFTNSLKGT